MQSAGSELCESRRTVGAFGDVDLEYLASVHELETASSQDLLGPMTTGGQQHPLACAKQSALQGCWTTILTYH